MAYLTCAQIVARIRARFDIANQTTRHTDASLVDAFNDCAREVRAELFSSGCRTGLRVVTVSSDDAEAGGDYPGQRIDAFGDSGAHVERITAVSWTDDSGTVRPLDEETLSRLSELVSSGETGDPLVWSPAVFDYSGALTMGVMVAPLLDGAKTFTIECLPALMPIRLASAGPPAVTDVGIDDLEVPFEWILWSVGCLLGVRDDDAQNLGYRDQRRQQARDVAIQRGLSQTHLTEIRRGRVRPSGADRLRRLFD